MPLNCPSPLPAVPHLVTKLPMLSNFWTRLLLKSATKTFPPSSTARPTGLLNCPSPLPLLPHSVRKVPHGVIVVVVVLVVVVVVVVVLVVVVVVVEEVVVVVVGQTPVTISPPSIVTAGCTQLLSTR